MKQRLIQIIEKVEKHEITSNEAMKQVLDLYSKTELLCVNALGTSWLTSGKTYTLIDEEEENYLIEGDAGFKNWYGKDRFKVLETQCLTNGR